MAISRAAQSENYRYCDLVMKGGITSGVIYPRAVVELAEQYRFKNIGGTSAGAIAAAVTAAAELGRRRNHERAFSTVADLPNQLENGRLLALFTPDAKTRKLFSLFRGFIGVRTWPGKVIHSLLGVAKSALPWFTLTLLLGFFSPSLLYSLARWGSVQPILGLIFRHPYVCCFSGLVIALPLAFTVAALIAVASGIRGLAANGFGLCSGLASRDDNPNHSLIGWLHLRIQAAAGQEPARPVTFSDLWNAPPYPDEKIITDRTINFEVITTGLTEGRPFRVPFRQGALYYDPAELARLFPPEIMLALEEGSKKTEQRETASEHRVERMRDPRPVVSPSDSRKILQRLPKGGDLPIVVAARMSLSFPGLISAVPLYRIDYTLERNQRGKTDYETRVGTKVWFSDGGICSNFPLSFFDSPLPRWPTFGINLQQAGEMICKTDRSVSANFVRAPTATGSGPVVWNSIGDKRWTPKGFTEQRNPSQCVLKFVWAIINTMQNWRDNLQARAPGFRDRIVSVSLCTDEGGLNLGMPPELIKDLSARGAEAAQLLEREFDFAQHLFTRFRITICAVQEYLRSIREAYDGRFPQNALGWEYIEGKKMPPHYRWRHAKIRDSARKSLEQIVDLIESWDTAVRERAGFCAGVPKPKGELRSTPEL